MNPKLRVGAVSYLNTKPLVFGWEQIAPETELIFDLPSRLADGLALGRYDVALIPSVEYFQDSTYEIISDACIACRGPVWSVKLMSRTPISEIQTLALDEGSRTSAALVRILLKQRYQLEPVLKPLPIGAAAAAADTDAVLLIGDRAMRQPDPQFIEVWDLGEEWCRWSGLPFVFAMWVARGGTNLGDLPLQLERARNAGVKNLTDIAELEGAKYDLSPAACLGYLRDNLHFYLGPTERRGLDRFRGYVEQSTLNSVSVRDDCGRFAPCSASRRLQTVDPSLPERTP